MGVENNNGKIRYVWLDIARGICILLMVICHACASSNQRWGAFNGVTGVFFLIFFFVSAGFCFNEKRNIREYASVQIKKCIVPYLIFSVFYLGLMYHRNAISGNSVVSKLINAAASLVWGLSNRFTIGPVQTIGMGPMWFMVVFFLSTILYKLLGNRKYSGPVIIALAIVASLSQMWVVLPFTIQDACIGCMFIWIGNFCKKKFTFVVDWLHKTNLIKLLALAIVTTFFLSSLVGMCYLLGQRFSGRFLDLGSNSYSFSSLPASLMGCVAVVIWSIFIERTQVIDTFFAFCGKESFMILILHGIDISMVRHWGGRDLYFMAFTLLGYPLCVYFYRRWQQNSQIQKQLKKFLLRKRD